VTTRTKPIDNEARRKALKSRTHAVGPSPDLRMRSEPFEVTTPWQCVTIAVSKSMAKFFQARTEEIQSRLGNDVAIYAFRLEMDSSELQSVKNWMNVFGQIRKKTRPVFMELEMREHQWARIQSVCESCGLDIEAFIRAGLAVRKFQLQEFDRTPPAELAAASPAMRALFGLGGAS